jgi:hypothetical protein
MFKQVDYLSQILVLYIQDILEDFAIITYALNPIAEPLFIENRNTAYSYKSTTNYYAK